MRRLAAVTTSSSMRRISPVSQSRAVQVQDGAVCSAAWTARTTRTTIAESRGSGLQRRAQRTSATTPRRVARCPCRLHPTHVKEKRHRYRVGGVRADTLWRRTFGSARLSFVKVDLPWTAVGLEGLIEERAFRVLSIEVDASWGGRAVQGCWNV